MRGRERRGYTSSSRWFLFRASTPTPIHNPTIPERPPRSMELAPGAVQPSVEHQLWCHHTAHAAPAANPIQAPFRVESLTRW